MKFPGLRVNNMAIAHFATKWVVLRGTRLTIHGLADALAAA